MPCTGVYELMSNWDGGFVYPYCPAVWLRAYVSARTQYPCYSNCRADDPDGEFSGFSLTTHILQNERYDTTDPSTDELPLMMLRPFAVVCRLTQTPKRIISSL